MTKLTNLSGVDFEAFKVCGTEERDSNSVNILVENDSDIIRHPMTREEHKATRISNGDYLIITPNDTEEGARSFINATQFSAMITELQPETLQSATSIADNLPEAPDAPVLSVAVPAELAGDPDNLPPKVLDEPGAPTVEPEDTESLADSPSDSETGLGSAAE